MREKVEVPERIWANFYDDGTPMSGDCFDDPIADGLTEYVRADTVPSWSADMDAAPAHILLWVWTAYGPAVAEKFANDDWGIIGDDASPRLAPTHWMPITLPPETP